MHVVFLSVLFSLASSSSLRGILCIFGSRTVFFKSISWMCKKQSAVSHNSAESEILSLDAGFTRKWSTRASVLECVMQTLNLHRSSVQREAEARCHCTHLQRSLSFENIDHGPATILHLSSTNTTLPVGRHCGSDPIGHGRTKPKLEARHKNARS